MVTIQRDTARFRRRVPGHVPGQGRCHSQIELSADGEFVLLHLASVSWFSIALDRPALLRLLHLLDEPEPCRIPVWHDDDNAGWPFVRTRSVPRFRLYIAATGLPSSCRCPHDAGTSGSSSSRELHDLRRDLTAAYLQLESP